MFFVIYNPKDILKDEINAVFKESVMRFSEYMASERLKPENKELFIAGEGTVITRLLEKVATDERLMSEKNAIMFDEDIIGRIDEAIKIAPYFAKLLNLGIAIFYCAKYESTVVRLEETGLCDDICEMS
jgi:hypothetical protein